jgi:hypothetical protein
MLGRPGPSEAAPYYFRYIDQFQGTNIVVGLSEQLDQTLAVGAGISEAQSCFRYADGKWSIREVLNHITDSERVFAFRAVWFARGFDTAMPSYDQDIACQRAEADQVGWSAHIEEFRRVRLSTLSLFEHLPSDSWLRTGVASDTSFSVRALAYIIGGHCTHHISLLYKHYAGALIR